MDCFTHCPSLQIEQFTNPAVQFARLRLGPKSGCWEAKFRHVSFNIKFYSISETHTQYSLLDAIFTMFLFWTSRNISILESSKPTTCQQFAKMIQNREVWTIRPSGWIWLTVFVCLTSQSSAQKRNTLDFRNQDTCDAKSVLRCRDVLELMCATSLPDVYSTIAWI